MEPEVPTEIDSDGEVFLGQKRTASTRLHDTR